MFSIPQFSRTLGAVAFKIHELYRILISGYLTKDFDAIYLTNVPMTHYSAYLKLLSKVRNKRVKIIAHAFHPYTPEVGRFHGNHRWLLSHGSTDHIFCINNRLVSHYSKILNPDNVHHVPYPVDTERFRPRDITEARKLLKLPENARIIGYVGHLTLDRGVYDLVEAVGGMSSHRDLVLAIVSSPFVTEEHYKDFMHHVKKCGVEDRIRILNQRGNYYYNALFSNFNHIEHFYNAVDVAALPFQKPYTIIDPPVTILEAMSSGTPLITTEAGAIREVADNKNAVPVPPYNKGRLQEALNKLLGDDEAQGSLSSAARAHMVKNFSHEVIGQQMIKIFNEIIG
jgi:glycosyltransferase involved in cell wall biosynthesis